VNLCPESDKPASNRTCARTTAKRNSDSV